MSNDQCLVSVSKLLDILRFEAARSHDANPDTVPKFEANSWMDRSDMAAALDSTGSRVAFACGRTLVVSHLRAQIREASGMAASTTPPLVAGGDIVHWMHCPDTGRQTSSTLAAAGGGSITCVTWVQLPRDFTVEELGPHDQLQVALDVGGSADDGDGAFESLHGEGAAGWHVLLLGTSNGHFQLHNSGGSMLHQQRFHDGAVMNIQVSTPSFGRQQGNQMQHIVLTYTDAIVQIPMTEIKRFMNAFHNRSPLPKLNHTRCRFPKSIQERSDAVCMPHVRPLLDDMLRVPSPTEPLILTAGIAPAVASFQLEEAEEHEEGRPAVWSPTKLLGVGPNLFGSPSSPGPQTNPIERALNYLSGRQENTRDIVTSRIIADDREVHSLSVAPCGNLATCLDGKGRILLLDMSNMCTIRIWKGYRDVHCGWLEHAALGKEEGEDNLWTIPADRVGAALDRSSQALSGNDATVLENDNIAPVHRSASEDGAEAEAYNPVQTRLYLVIYAPKREVVEVWPMRVGKKARSFRCGSNCALLQPGAVVGHPCRSPSSSPRQGATRSLSTCYVLNGTTGELFNLAERLGS